MDLLTYKRDSVLKNQSVRESALKGMNLLKIEIHMTQMNAWNSLIATCISTDIKCSDDVF